jgi:hypothetical protein
MTKTKNIALAFSMIMLFAGTGVAGTIKSLPVPPELQQRNPLAVTYLGEDANYVFFRVSVKAASSKFVSFAVSDKEEGELYTAVFGSNKELTVKVEKRGQQELDFKLLDGNKSYSKSFLTVTGASVTSEKF